jgi:spore coat polysaccharide biosynthesis protein SpsF
MMSIDKKVVAIIQARMTSSRLPGKVMREIAGYPMIYHVIHRVGLSTLIDEVVVATTTNTQDDEIAQFCQENNISCFRGHPYDVLDRFYQTALAYQADIIVRITADCPIMDSALIDELVTNFLGSEVDFAANRLPPPWKRSYPIGLDIEIVSFQNLEKAWEEATSTFEREHVMPYFYDEPCRFKILVKHHDPDYGARRLTVDTPQDLEFVREIYEHFSPQINFSWLEVMELLNNQPELEEINATVQAKKVDEVDERFSEGGK